MASVPQECEVWLGREGPSPVSDVWRRCSNDTWVEESPVGGEEAGFLVHTCPLMEYEPGWLLERGSGSCLCLGHLDVGWLSHFSVSDASPLGGYLHCHMLLPRKQLFSHPHKDVVVRALGQSHEYPSFPAPSLPQGHLPKGPPPTSAFSVSCSASPHFGELAPPGAACPQQARFICLSSIFHTRGHPVLSFEFLWPVPANARF